MLYLGHHRTLDRLPKWVAACLWIACLLGALALSVEGESAESYTAKRWRMEDGMPQETVGSLAQSADGDIWIATRAGLATFDGYRFRVFDRLSIPELGSSVVADLHLGQDGGLWVGTLGSGALKLRGDGSATVIEVIGSGQGLPDLRVIEMLELPNGELWLGTQGAGRVVRAADGNLSVTGKVQGEPVMITALEPGSDSAVWIGSDQGVSLFRDRRIVARWGLSDGLPSPMVWDLEEDSQGTLWIATDLGLASLDSAGFVRTHRVGEGGLRTTAIQIGRRGEVWVGTFGRGVYVSASKGRGLPDPTPGVEGLGSGARDFRPEQGVLAEDQVVLSFLEDRVGRLWYGTLSDGLNRIERSVFDLYGPAQGLSSNIVTAVLGASDGSVWVATRDAGVDRWRNGEIESYGRAQGFDAKGIWSMASAPDGGLWLGTDGRGLYHLSGGAAQPVPLKGLDAGRVFALANGHGSDLWIGTNEGLLFWPDAQAVGEPADLRPFGVDEGLPGRQIRCLLFDRRGRLWIGTVDGLGLLAEGRIEPWPELAAIAVDSVFGLYEDSQGAVWVGTFGSGLLRIEGRQIRRLGTREGLFSDQIATILEDGLGNFWLGSPQGVVRVEGQALRRKMAGGSEDLPQLFFGRRDGLTGGGVWGAQQSSAKDADGFLWFGTHQGLASLNPREIQPRPAPRVTIDKVLLGGFLHHPGRRSVVPAGTRGYEIEYSIPMPLAPEKIKIRYRLEGFDREWTDGTGRWRKTYTRLPPGDYAFVIQASDESGRFQGGQTRYSFRVAAGFSSSWWFRGLCGLGLILIAYGFHRWRVAKLERRRQELTSRVEEALKDVAVLDGLLPICGTCRKVRDDQGYWTQVEAFLDEHSEASFTHGLCPSCSEQAMRELDHESPPAHRA